MGIKIEGAPGLAWRERAGGDVAYWVADRKIVQLGYPLKTQRLWAPADAGEPDASTQTYIKDECLRLQAEMHAWKQGRETPSRDGDGRPEFDGTITSLSRCYQRDSDSEYAGVRYKTQQYYDGQLAQLERTIGARSLAAVTARDVKRWYANWSIDPDGSKHLPRAKALLTMLRSLLKYGATMLEDAQCIRVRAFTSGGDGLKFKSAGRRRVTITAEQATAIRHRAHAMGFPEIALGQALQFDLLIRPKDAIGEMIPLSEPGVSDIVMDGKKWVVGVHWREVSADLILTHTLSKSLKGRDALANPDAEQKEKVWDLKRYPMVAEELARIPLERRVGPMVKDHKTGMPFGCDDGYRRYWRKVADAVGVPRDVQNRDSRAGGITETIRATGGNVDAARIAAGHSNIETTGIYNREETERMAEVADLRAARRIKNGA